MAFVLRRLAPLVLVALAWVPAASAWSWPVDGPVLQQFSFDSAHPYASGQHRGIDIGAPSGTPVLAPAAGTVTFAGNVPTSGTSLTIGTADGYSVTLTHLGSIAVARGDTVVEGGPVGTVGPSGTPELDVPYLHLGIRVASDPDGYVDPIGLLPALVSQAPPDASGTPAGSGSSAPPVETTPATTTAAAPETPAPAPAVSAPSAASPARAPAVPRARPRTSASAGQEPAASESVHAVEPSPAHAPAAVHPYARARDGRPAAGATRSGRGRASRQPQPAAEGQVQPRHRPVPVRQAPSREQPVVRATPRPAGWLVPGASAAALAVAVAGLLGFVRLRRRPIRSPEGGAVVIPLPQRPNRLQERRVA